MKDFKFLKEPLYKRIYDIAVEIGDNVIDNNDEYMEKVYFRDEVKIQYAYMDMDLGEDYYVLVIKCIPNDELVIKFLSFRCELDNNEWVYDGEYVM
jgi:hypothetical protein